MKTIIKYFLFHLKYWYLYVATVILIPIALYFTLQFMRAYDYLFGEGILFDLVTYTTFAVFATPLLIIPNKKAAKEISKSGDIREVKQLTIINHSVTLIVFSIIGYFISEYLNKVS